VWLVLWCACAALVGGWLIGAGVASWWWRRRLAGAESELARERFRAVVERQLWEAQAARARRVLEHVVVELEGEGEELDVLLWDLEMDGVTE
jgi:hypothetical protein